MGRIETVRYWRGKHATIPTNNISGRLLFEEDTGDVFLEYLDLSNGNIVRKQLTDNRKFDIKGGTFTGDVYLYRDPVSNMSPATKQYVDTVSGNLNQHTSNGDIHITPQERNTWNNKVDKVPGKGLSTNDFTNGLKDKLNGIADGADNVEYAPIQTTGTAIGKITINGDIYTIYAPNVTSISGNAGSATKLKTARYIDGISFDGTHDVVHYAISNTEGSTKAKTAYIENYHLDVGSQVSIYFENDNTATNPTLNVTSTGASPITYQGQAIPANKLNKGLHTFIYDGDSYELVGSIDTQYNNATHSSAGLMSPEDKTNLDAIKSKVDGIESGANKYVLPKATRTTLGGVIVGDNISLNESTGRIYLTSDDVIHALGYTPTDGAMDADRIRRVIGNFQGATANSDGAAGFVPAPKKASQDYNKYLKGDGTWDDLDIPDFAGATSTTAGTSGSVPAPTPDDVNSVLLGSGDWKDLTEIAFENKISSQYPNVEFVDPGKYNIEYSNSSVYITSKSGNITHQQGKTYALKLIGIQSQTGSTVGYLLFTPNTRNWNLDSSASSSNIAIFWNDYDRETGEVECSYFHKATSSSTPVTDVNDGYVITLNSKQIMKGATATTAGTAGDAPKPEAGDNVKFLRGDGTWQEISTEAPVLMVGATATTNGKAGYVIAPKKTEYLKFLRGDGTWQAIPTLSGSTSSQAGTAGLAPAPSAGSQNYYLQGNGQWTDVFADSLKVTKPTSIQNNYYLRGDNTWQQISGITNARIDQICPDIIIGS